MRPFNPKPSSVAFFNALEAAAKGARVTGYLWGGYTFRYVSYPLPPLPPRPTDPVEAAFIDNVCMPLYNQMQAANAKMQATMSGSTAPAVPTDTTPVDWSSVGTGSAP